MDFKTIESKENKNIKTAHKLALKKYRDKLNKFTVENWVLIQDAFESGHNFEEIFLTKEFFAKHKKEIELLKKKIDKDRFYLIDDKINKHISQLKTPSGVLAVYGRSDFKIEEGKSVIYLNGINDPGNLGTILRTCLAFNFKNVIIDDRCADIYNYKTINAAKDSLFKINFLKDINKEWINNSELPIYVTLPNRGKSLKEFSLIENFCLVLGGEGNGIDEEIVKMAKEKINIKTSPSIESLNVAISASIILYEFFNK
ncbi:RNA methyltransferase [bacterium]|nr:RNA methyltransferase [bacterium]